MHETTIISYYNSQSKKFVDNSNKAASAVGDNKGLLISDGAVPSAFPRMLSAVVAASDEVLPAFSI